MAILSKGNTYSSGDSVTAANLNSLVDSATFVSGSNETTDNTSLEVHSSGYLQVKDDGITNAKIATGAVNADSIAADAVITAKIADSTGDSDGVTTAKIAGNAITSAKISDTDAQFLVDDTSTQKKVVINESGADVDFRVEGNANANLISTTASNDNIGIGGAPSSTATTTLLVSHIDSKFLATGSNNSTVWSQSPQGTAYFILYAQSAAANQKRVNMAIDQGGDGAGLGQFGISWVNDDASAGQGMIFKTDGSLTIGGALSKGSGSFKIDHPIKPETHHLVHSFVESPQADLIYRGKYLLWMELLK